MKSNFLFIYLLLFSFFGYAQSYDIGGTVKEAGTGLPIPGVNIQIKGSTKGTSTDLDGIFSLSGIADGSAVVFSYIGYTTYEYKVTASNTNLTVSLQEDTQGLEEVVVIGYGSQKRKELTGAVSTVDAKTLDILKPIKVEQALQGTVAGVVVTGQSGAPGAGLNIRIRGIATNGNNAPAVIIDGYVGEIGLLNPNDIETITVLKDAQASIYGTIGANGVILITTKKGRKNSKPTINYNVYTGFQETSRKLSVLNGTEYALLANEAYANAGRTLPFPNVSEIGKGTDWQDQVFGKGVPIINHDINVTGGSDKVTYAISGSHLDQEGIVGAKKSGFLRNTARVALTADISDRLKINTNVIYTYFNRKTLNENVLGSVLFNALNMPANLSPFDANGDYTLVPSAAAYGTEIINPLAQIANTYNDYNYKKLNGTFGFDYKVATGLTLTSRIGFNTSNSEGRSFAMEVDYGGKIYDTDRSSVNQNAINDNNYSFDIFAEYKKAFSNHNFAVTLGSTIFKEWGNGLYATGFDVPYNSWKYADVSLAIGPADDITNSSYTYDVRRLSHFGRLQYDYKGKYLLSALFRRDASTKFGPQNAVANFHSYTGGWIVSDEDFYGDSNIINFFKVRASYGTLGNDQIDNDKYSSLLNGEATYVFDGNTIVNGTATGGIANPNVKWEKSEKIDFGVDLNVFNNKVTIVADYFNDTRKDLLIIGTPVTGAAGGAAPGAGMPTINAGAVKNYGYEFAIGYKDNIGDDFSFDINYNVTLIKNKVTEVSNGTGIVTGGLFGESTLISRMEVGHALGYFYGYKTDGIFQNQAEVDAHPSQIELGAEAQPGDIRFKDVNGDGAIDTNDRTDLGNPIPAATMGLNLQLNYKGFDFVAFTYASVGNEMVRNYERNADLGNRLRYTLDRWTGEGTSNTVPRATTGVTANGNFSDYYVEDASFIRIQNIQLGYTLDSRIFGKSGITKTRIYAGVNNLYTFTKYRGYDPGASSGAPIGGGIDYGFYPIPRTFMLGANINF